MKNILMGLGTLTLWLSTASVAMADPLCSSAAGGFQLVNGNVVNGQVFSGNGLFTGGTNGCTINGLDFSNFQISPNTGYAGAGANLNVTISAVDGTNTLGIATNMGAGSDVEIEFSVTPGSYTSDLLTVGGGGGVNEVVCSTQMVIGNGTGTGSCSFVSGVTLGSGTVGGGTSSTTIALTPSSTQYFFKDISNASEVSQQFSNSSIPEPMTLSMMGAGLLGLGLFGRRLRK